GRNRRKRFLRTSASLPPAKGVAFAGCVGTRRQSMRIGMIGLGRMGANMVRRLVKGGHECVAYDRKPATVAALAAEGAQGAKSLAELVRALPPPRAVWIWGRRGTAAPVTWRCNRLPDAAVVAIE